MTERENLIRCLRRNSPDHIPFYFNLCASLKRKFEEKTGHRQYEAYYGMPVRSVFLNPTKNKNDYSGYFKNLPGNAYINEWGIGMQKGDVEHFERMIHPMSHFDSVRQIIEYPLPDFLEEYRWDGIKERIKHIHDEGNAAMTGVHPNFENEVYLFIDIFEPSWYLRGMEQLLVDFYTDEQLAEALLDRITQFKVKTAEKWAECGVDIIVFSDDVGTQKGMLMSPDIWRKWIKPRLCKVIKAAKRVNSHVLIFYHSDGNIREIIDDLIEAGVEVLNPVQPECMDPVEIKKLYGNRLSFWGTIGTQTTMPFGSPEEVERVCRKMIEKVGYDGGLVIAPTHLLEPEVPWENIEALVNTVKNHGIC